MKWGSWKEMMAKVPACERKTSKGGAVNMEGAIDGCRRRGGGGSQERGPWWWCGCGSRRRPWRDVRLREDETEEEWRQGGEGWGEDRTQV